MKKSQTCPVFQSSQQPLDLYLAIATCRDGTCAWWNAERGTCGCMMLRQPPRQQMTVQPQIRQRLRLHLVSPLKRLRGGSTRLNPQAIDG